MRLEVGGTDAADASDGRDDFTIVDQIGGLHFGIQPFSALSSSEARFVVARTNNLYLFRLSCRMSTWRELYLP
jgi:hypothetical protein